MESLPKDRFDGIREPIQPDDEVTNIEPEDLQIELDKRSKIEKIISEYAGKALRGKTASFVFRISLYVTAGFVAWGAYSQDYEPAETWWIFVGPLVGYLLRAIFEGNNRSP